MLVRAKGYGYVAERTCACCGRKWAIKTKHDTSEECETCRGELDDEKSSCVERIKSRAASDE